MAKIVVKFKSAARQECALDKAVVHIGRSHDCEIHIDNQGISRKHARIVQQDGRFWVEDLNSHNGTYIGNQRIQRHLLRDGDEILVGKHTLQFYAMEDAEPSTPKEALSSSMASAIADIAGEDMDGTLMMKAPVGGGSTRKAGGGKSGGSGPQGQIDVMPMGKQLPGFRSHFDLGDTTTFGKSASATIRLAGWFLPSLVGAITRDEGGFFAVPGGGWTKMRLNGDKLTGRSQLNSGDILEIRSYKFQFQIK